MKRFILFGEQVVPDSKYVAVKKHRDDLLKTKNGLLSEYNALLAKYESLIAKYERPRGKNGRFVQKNKK